MRTYTVAVSGVLAAILTVSSGARADAACPNNSNTLKLYGNPDLSGSNQVWLGRVAFLGSYVLAAYIRTGTSSCASYLVTDPNGQLLTGQYFHNNICAGAGNDSVDVLPPPPSTCTNLPTMSAWNYNGYDLAVYGEAGNDVFQDGAGKDAFWGGPGADIAYFDRGGTLEPFKGESDNDWVNHYNYNGVLYGGDGADVLMQTRCDSYSDIFLGEAGNDHLYDKNQSYYYFDGGAGTDQCFPMANCEALWSVTGC
ncbi:MAG: hypothetical protein H6717_34430 [Polyangiaceae bacterium]|nr:hypothetical protein [Polyangiaceae bacterium]